MIYRESLPLKNISLWCLLVCCVLVAAYIVFVAIISIYVGMNHIHQDGFWMPIFAGVSSIIVILWLFMGFLKFILNRMKEEDIFNI